MQWGQFVAHDVSNLAIDTNGEGNIVQLFHFIFYIMIRCIEILDKLDIALIFLCTIKITMYNFLDCCVSKNEVGVSKACEATIKIPTDDPVYSKYNTTCMRFTRAMTSNNYNCPLQPSTFVRHHHIIYHSS